MTISDVAADVLVEADALDPDHPGHSAARRSLSGFRLLAIAYLALIVICAIFAPLVAPHDPNAQDLVHAYLSPHWGSHLLGTDQFGRDELSRLIYGARTSMIAALIGTTTAVCLGTPLGMLAAFLGRVADGTLSFLNSALMSIPALIIVLTTLAIIGPGLTKAMIVIGIVFSPVFFRLARAATIDVRSEAFIEASVALGCSRWRTLWRHIVPNAVAPIVVQAAVTAGLSIIAEASLSYLGFGVSPPTASWGSMLTDATNDIYRSRFLVYFPGLMIASTVYSLFVLGEWLRESLAADTRVRAQ